jgi:transcriptional regulator with XRE-family HTH domain
MGYTRKGLALMMRVSPQTVQKWEEGHLEGLDEKTKARLARELETTVTSLFEAQD